MDILRGVFDSFHLLGGCMWGLSPRRKVGGTSRKVRHNCLERKIGKVSTQGFLLFQPVAYFPLPPHKCFPGNKQTKPWLVVQLLSYFPLNLFEIIMASQMRHLQESEVNEDKGKMTKQSFERTKGQGLVKQETRVKHNGIGLIDCSLVVFWYTRRGGGFDKFLEDLANSWIYFSLSHIGPHWWVYAYNMGLIDCC